MLYNYYISERHHHTRRGFICACCVERWIADNKHTISFLRVLIALYISAQGHKLHVFRPSANFFHYEVRQAPSWEICGSRSENTMQVMSVGWMMLTMPIWTKTSVFPQKVQKRGVFEPSLESGIIWHKTYLITHKRHYPTSITQFRRVSPSFLKVFILGRTNNLFSGQKTPYSVRSTFFCPADKNNEFLYLFWVWKNTSFLSGQSHVNCYMVL